MDAVFFLDVSIAGCDAEVFLNGAPIVRVTPETSSPSFPTVSQWTVDGENELTVALTAAANGGDEPRVKVTLTSGEAGGFPDADAGPAYARIDETPEPGAAGLAYTAAGEVHHPWGAWSWQTAPVIELDAATVGGLTAFLQTLHAALAQRRLDPLLDACETMFAEVGRCYGMSAADGRAQMQAGIGYVSRSPEWALAPIEASDLEFRPCCGGRLVQPLTRAGEPALRQAAAVAGESWSLPVFIARGDGGFRIVR